MKQAPALSFEFPDTRMFLLHKTPYYLILQHLTFLQPSKEGFSSSRCGLFVRNGIFFFFIVKDTFNNHCMLKIFLLPFSTTVCITKGKNQKQMLRKYQTGVSIIHRQTTTRSNTSRFCLKNMSFSSSLITSGVCGNRDRLEVTCWSSRGFEKGSSTLSHCSPLHGEGGKVPAVEGSSGAAVLPSLLLVLPTSSELHHKQLQNFVKNVMRKGWNKTPKEVHVDLTEGERARFAGGNWAVFSSWSNFTPVAGDFRGPLT